MRPSVVVLFVLMWCGTDRSIAQHLIPPDTSDTTEQPVYDPFGPENSPDHNGQGSGGVITPSPYENLMQTYYTRISSDYYGVQYMLDSPWQIALGHGWASYQEHKAGILFKMRSSGLREEQYDPIREEYVPLYRGSFEGSFDRPLRENKFRAFKFRFHFLSEPKGLSMAGIGVLVSRWNLMLAADHSMDRRLDVEATWIQVAGGYVMPLSPNKGGVNIAICGGVDLLGVKYETYYSDRGDFVGTKVGSIGWLLGVGWNASTLVNLSAYVGGEWSFSTGGLGLPTDKIVRSDIARNTLYFGLQATGRWFNLVAGTQKEWEYLDFQKIVLSDKGLRYYVGANFYFRR
jgi:hypothetical protein